MNDAKLLSANYMFVFTGGTFILGSIFMNFARITHNRTHQSNNQTTDLKDVDNTDQKISNEVLESKAQGDFIGGTTKIDDSATAQDYCFDNKAFDINDGHNENEIETSKDASEEKSANEFSFTNKTFDIDEVCENKRPCDHQKMDISPSKLTSRTNEFSFENKVFYIDAPDF